DRVSVPYPLDERSRRTISSLLHGPLVYAIPHKPVARAAFSRLQMSARAVTAEPWDEAIGFKVFQNECGAVSPPDLQLREDHAARCGSDRSWLRGQGHAGEPALRPRPRPLQGGARRRRANHGRVYAGSAAVPGSRGEFAGSPTHL